MLSSCNKYHMTTVNKDLWHLNKVETELEISPTENDGKSLWITPGFSHHVISWPHAEGQKRDEDGEEEEDKMKKNETENHKVEDDEMEEDGAAEN